MPMEQLRLILDANKYGQNILLSPTYSRPEKHDCNNTKLTEKNSSSE